MEVSSRQRPPLIAVALGLLLLVCLQLGCHSVQAASGVDAKSKAVPASNAHSDSRVLHHQRPALAAQLEVSTSQASQRTAAQKATAKSKGKCKGYDCGSQSWSDFERQQESTMVPDYRMSPQAGWASQATPGPVMPAANLGRYGGRVMQLGPGQSLNPQAASSPQSRWNNGAAPNANAAGAGRFGAMPPNGMGGVTAPDGSPQGAGGPMDDGEVMQRVDATHDLIKQQIDSVKANRDKLIQSMGYIKNALKRLGLHREEEEMREQQEHQYEEESAITGRGRRNSAELDRLADEEEEALGVRHGRRSSYSNGDSPDLNNGDSPPDDRPRHPAERRLIENMEESHTQQEQALHKLNNELRNKISQMSHEQIMQFLSSGAGALAPPVQVPPQPFQQPPQQPPAPPTAPPAQPHDSSKVETHLKEVEDEEISARDQMQRIEAKLESVMRKLKVHSDGQTEHLKEELDHLKHLQPPAGLGKVIGEITESLRKTANKVEELHSKLGEEKGSSESSEGSSSGSSDDEDESTEDEEGSGEEEESSGEEEEESGKKKKKKDKKKKKKGKNNGDEEEEEEGGQDEEEGGEDEEGGGGNNNHNNHNGDNTADSDQLAQNALRNIERAP